MEKDENIVSVKIDLLRSEKDDARKVKRNRSWRQLFLEMLENEQERGTSK